MGLLFALSPLVLAAGAVEVPPCNPISGWEQALADEQVRWIVIGEMHGTSETPAIFADAVCLTAQTRPVVVAIEQPATEQGAIDAYLASDGGAAARRAFLASPMWHAPMKDGRSSEAGFRLFETLRQMKAAGRIAAVVAFQTARFEAGRFAQEPTERAMAELIVAGTPPGATVLVLTGNLHARLTPTPWGSGYVPMAGHLPPAATLTLDARGEGGEAWVCQGPPGPDQCRGRPMGTGPSPQPRGLVLEPAQDGAYSGLLHLGVATTASPPQQEQ